MTALDLDRLETLAAAATPGSWWIDWESTKETMLSCDAGNVATVHLGEPTGPDGRPDAALIAAARDALPALVSEVRRLAAESEARRLVLVLKATELRQEGLRAERAEEALRDAADDLTTWLERDDNPFGPSSLRPHPCAPGFVRDRLRAILSPLPAPQPAPEVAP